MSSARTTAAPVSRRALLAGLAGLALAGCSASRASTPSADPPASDPSPSSAPSSALPSGSDPSGASSAASASPSPASATIGSGAGGAGSAGPGSSPAPSASTSAAAADQVATASPSPAPSSSATRASATTVAPRAAATPVGPVLVQVPASGHTVPGQLTLPGGSTGSVPVVVMLHGDGANDVGPGALFVPLAEQLARQGVASMRIDFAGSAPSTPNQPATQKQTDLTYTGMVLDTSAVVGYLSADSRFDPSRISVLGHSRGGQVGATIAGTVPGIAAFVSWSGLIVDHPAVSPIKYAAAKAAGHYMDGGWDYSVGWYDTITASTALSDVKGYRGPVLGLVGSLDTVDVPAITKTFIDDSTSPDKTYHEVSGADHNMGVGNAQQTADTLGTTADWLLDRLVAR